MQRVFALGTFALLAAAPAVAATETSTQRGEFAQLQGMIESGDGCSYTLVTLYVAENVALGGGAPSTSVSGYGWWDTYNSCDGSFTWTDGTLTSVSLATTSSTAQVTAEVALTDWFTGESAGTMSVDLTVSGDGTAYRGISNTSYTTGGGFFRTRSVGTSYNGSVSGTARGETITSGFGTWGSSTSGSVTRYTF